MNFGQANRESSDPSQPFEAVVILRNSEALGSVEEFREIAHRLRGNSVEIWTITQNDPLPGLAGLRLVRSPALPIRPRSFSPWSRTREWPGDRPGQLELLGLRNRSRKDER